MNRWSERRKQRMLEKEKQNNEWNNDNDTVKG